MRKLELEPIDDGNSNFEKVEFRDSGNTGTDTPHCTDHGAMNKVAAWENNEGMWRCLRSENTEDCRAGAIERRDRFENFTKVIRKVGAIAGSALMVGLTMGTDEMSEPVDSSKEVVNTVD